MIQLTIFSQAYQIYILATSVTWIQPSTQPAGTRIFFNSGASLEVFENPDAVASLIALALSTNPSIPLHEPVPV